MEENTGDRIRRLREAKEWSVGELSRRSGVDKGTISRVERGRNQPGPRTIRDLAAALGVDAKDLVKRN